MKFIKGLSKSRARLRDALDAKSAAQAGLDLAQARIDKLRAVATAVEPAQAALAAFDADQARQMAQWAVSTDGSEAPKADADSRATMVRALEDAETAARAATAAMAALNADATAAAKRVSDANAEARICAKIVMCEEAERLLPSMTKAIAHAEELRHRLDAARAAVFDGLDPSLDENRPVLVALASLNEARRIAESRPHDPEENPFRADWLRFALALSGDATATFGDVGPALPRPPIAEARPYDQVAAQVAAIASFPTISVQR